MSVKFDMVAENGKFLFNALRLAYGDIFKNIYDFSAFETDKMMMRFGVGIVPLPLRIDGELPHGSRLRKGIQGVVDGGKGEGKILLRHSPVHILSGRMERVSLEIVEDGEPLWSPLEPFAESLFQRLFHDSIIWNKYNLRTVLCQEIFQCR